MARRRQVILLILVGGVAAFAVIWGIVQGTDFALAVLTVAVVGLTAATLIAVSPRPAELWVERQDELDLDDLIFYVFPQPATAGEQQVPRDFLLQFHVAVINVGGRNAVLSALRLNEFVDERGEPVRLPEVPLPLVGTRTAQQSGWINNQYHSQLLTVLPPYVLEPDDVITLRFRCRRGIDWSDRWGLAELRSFADAIERLIAGATITAVYRRAATVQERSFTVAVRVLQQRIFYELIRSLTQNFTTRPTVAEQPISLE